MQCLQGSHTEGYFEHVQSLREGNVLNENQDILIPERYKGRVIQTQLRPGEASFHDGRILTRPKVFYVRYHYL